MGLLDRFRRPGAADAPPDAGGRTGTSGPDDPAAWTDPAEVGPQSFARLGALAERGAPTGEQRAEVARVLRLHGVPGDLAGTFTADMADGILLSEHGAVDERLRLGGPPVLPAGEAWPHSHDGRPLSFVAAWDLAALPELSPLPRAGTLLLFWDRDFPRDDRMDFVTATRVFLLAPGASTAPAPRPAGTVAFGPIPLRPLRMPFVVDGERLRDDVPDDVPGLDLLDMLLEQYGSHALLGASRDIQGPVLDEVAHWLAQGHPETRERYSPAERAGEGWAFLAQIDETAGFELADVGALYLVIPRVDLEAARFDRVMGILQT
ncbi:DUF1963 domain-containing protein [Patulibacter americanus]|uniref:DUF1963 domain-containing protein n=1 Tax=Patulibacter americanus TaxID=588672 RepID=UPI0003B5871F|nr:DUF1963 domain-containing protein [Patulibacter americanus]